MNVPFGPMNLYFTYGHSLNVLKILTFYKIPILYCLRLSPKLDFISTKPIHFKMQRIKIEQAETQMSRHALCLAAVSDLKGKCTEQKSPKQLERSCCLGCF